VTKVLIIRCGALGDLVYATSVINAIKYEYGEDTLIDFVSTPGTAKLFEKDDRVNHAFYLKHKKIPVWLSAQKKEIIKHSQKEPYDILINFEYGKQFKSLINAIVAKRKVGANLECEDIPKEITHVVETTKYMFKIIVSDAVYQKSFPKLIGTQVDEVKNKFDLPDKYLIISPSNSHQKT
jgi:ADP-heptose:LPS heptosyltransferase